MKTSWLSIAVISAAAILSGCAPSGFDRGLNRRMQARLAPAPQPASVSPVLAGALVPPISINLPHRRRLLLPARFDFSATAAPAAQVFMALVRGTPYSIALPNGLSGRITVHLKNVTVPMAMRIIRRESGYQYRRRGDTYYVLSAGLETRLFRVHYLNIVRTGTSETELSANSLSEVGTTGTTGSMGAAGPTQTQKPSILVKTTSRSDFWKTLTRTVTALVGKGPGRKVVVEPQAGLLVVRADPATLHTISRFLRATQTNVNREVVIDAKILEVDLKSGYQSGIDWAQLENAGNASILAAQTGGGQLVTANTTTAAGQTGNINPQTGIYQPIDSTLASAFGGIFSLAVHTGNFSTFIQLLSTEGRVQVLSSPRVSTVNEQKAVIKVGGDQFYVTGVTNTESLVGVTAFSTPSVELTPFFSGVALDVTPEIDGHGAIILYIHPSVSKVTQVNQQFNVSGQSFNLPLASSSVQESDSVVRAHSGQVIVIGGLMKEGAVNNNASVPILGNIPLLGNLFKDKQITRVKEELVILLKPTIVDMGTPWHRQMVRARRQMARITRLTSR